MNTKISFFNPTVLKKDLTRFLPLWVVYLILGLLVMLSVTDDMYFYVAENAASALSVLSVVNMIYALLTAQMLFGELFQSRMCNAVHALPVRREGLFITHFTAGILMSLVPNLVIALIGMPSLERLWFMALLWWLALALQYLLFFGIAVFCMHCAGNRFAGVAIYVLLNFVSLVVMWFFEALYLPMLYGLKMTDSLRNIFYLFSPVVKLANGGEWLIIEHSSLCQMPHESSYYQVYSCLYYFKGFGDIWTYLIIAAVVGVLFAVAAFFIYRRRHMESAGDFVSFKPMGTFFTLLASASLALALHAVVPTAGMIVGALIGFFVCRMLLERTIKVFNKKSWLYLTGLCLFIGLTFALTAFDVGGVVSRIPDAEDVKSVTIADSYLSGWRLEDISMEQQDDSKIVLTGADPYYQYGKDGMITLTEPDQIRDIQQIHKLLIDEGDASKQNVSVTTVTIHYVLKNGTTLTRYYYTAKDSEALQRLQAYIATPQFVLGYDTAEDMLKYLNSVYIYDSEIRDAIQDRVWLEKLVDALFADANEGRLSSNANYVFEMQLEYEYDNGMYGGQALLIPDSAYHTLSWLKEYDAWLAENKQNDAA